MPDLVVLFGFNKTETTLSYLLLVGIDGQKELCD